MSDLPKARLVSPDSPPLPRTLAIVLAAMAGASMLHGILRTQLISKLQSGDTEDYSATLASLETLEIVFLPGLLGCGIALAVVVFLMWRKLTPGRLASVAFAAFVALAANVFLDLVLRIAQFAKLDWLSEFVWSNNNLIAALVLINSAAMASLLWFLHECTPRGRRTSLVWLGLAALGIQAAMNLYGLFAPPASRGSIWESFFFSTVTYNAAVAMAGWLAWRERRSLVTPGLTSYATWAPASRGLKLYERALVWRLVLMISGYVLLFMAIKGRSRDMVETLGWAIPLIAIITGALMTVGVFQFANQPLGARGRAPAVIAGVMMTVALIIDLVLFASLLHVLGMDDESSGYGRMADARDSLEAAQSMANWGMALSFAAFVALLVSFHHVARDFEDEVLAGLAFSVGLKVVLLGSLAWGLRYWLTSAKQLTMGTAMFAAVGTLIAVVVLVISHLSLVGKLSSRLANAGEMGLHEDV